MNPEPERCEPVVPRPAEAFGAGQATATPALQQHLALLQDVVRISSASLTLDDVLSRVMAVVSEHFAPQDWSILLRDEASGVLHFGLAMGRAGEELKALALARGEGVAGWVAEHDQPAVIPDVRRDARFSPRFDARSGFTTRSLVAMPLRAGGRVLGVMELCNICDGRQLPAAELDFLRVVCDSTGLAIDRALVYARTLELARSDPLSGLLNSTAFGEQVEALATARRGTPRPFSLVFLDVDDFKRVVEEHGHLQASRILAAVGARIRGRLPAGAVASRFGGDEYAVLLPEADRAAALAFARQLAHDLGDEPYPCPASTRPGGGAGIPSARLTFSMGLATAPSDGATADALLHASDVAMFAVKRDGKAGCRAAGS